MTAQKEKLWYLAALLSMIWLWQQQTLRVDSSRLFTKLATGQAIATAGAIPLTDPFSWTMAQKPWQPVEWLSDYITWQSYFFGLSAGGTQSGILLLYSALLMLGFYGLSLCLSRLGIKGVPALAAYAAFTLGTYDIYFVSSQIWVFALLPFFFAAALSNSKPALLSLFLVTVVWLNVNQYFYLSMLFVTILWLTEEDALGSYRAVMKFLCVLLGLFVAPNAKVIWQNVIASFSSKSGVLGELHSWHGPDFHQQPHLALLLVVLLGALLLMKRKLSWRWTWFAVVACALIFASARYQVAFAFVVAIVLAKAVESASRLKEGKYFSILESRGFNALVVLSLIAVLIGIAKVNRSLVPEQLQAVVPALATLSTPGELRLLHDVRYSGELIKNRIPVFIDSRTELYSDRIVAESYDSILALKPGWRELMDSYEINAVLLSSRSPLANVLLQTENWREIASGEERTVDYFGMLRGERVVLLGK